MAEEVQGQAETQPAIAVPESMNQFEAVAHIEAALERAEAPRDEQGKFLPKSKPEAQPETEAAEAKTEEEQPEPEEETEQPVRRFKLKYKGEEKEVDETEAISLAQQGYDYTQKSQALAKEREELGAKVRAEVEARQKEYEKQLEVHRKAVEKLVGVEDVDLNKLALEDPTRAQQEFFKRLQFQQTLSSIEAEQQKIAQQRQEEFKQTLRKQAEEAVEALQTKIPGWNNDLYGKTLKGAVEKYGFKSQEVNAITDHRAIEVLHDALKWREFQAAKPKTVDKRVAAVPKVTKPGTTEKPDSKAQKVEETKARLSKSGNRNDAVDLVMELMEQKRL